MSTNREIYKKKTKQIRISAEVHKALKLKAALSGTTLKRIIEDSLKGISSEYGQGPI